MTEKETVREEIIQEQAAQIAKLTERIAQQEAWSDTQNNIIRSHERLLKRIMQSLAVQNLVMNTHSQRNAENAEIVRSIHTELHQPITGYMSPRQELDDIPF